MACYHIWTEADTGDAFFRARRCFGSKSAADTLVSRGGNTGDRGRYLRAQRGRSMVLACREHCPCRWKCPHSETVPVEGDGLATPISQRASTDGRSVA